MSVSVCVSVRVSVCVCVSACAGGWVGAGLCVCERVCECVCVCVCTLPRALSVWVVASARSRVQAMMTTNYGPLDDSVEAAVTRTRARAHVHRHAPHSGMYCYVGASTVEK